ncbi:hypothetical protein PGB28_00505 [Primorskyibacter aestuariivivens]|uniref:tetratricopeptide repeat protein n=1 Tax=Primorskyibacter aestuariivivens TaxID=1888912 RepID=UPI00230149F2|nr:hypothetical protein [Primorskyibacter aestuariivivens]MDA7426919.1 hypothetical protein [Primorskyibacter aestuariivivens]
MTAKFIPSIPLATALALVLAASPALSQDTSETAAPPAAPTETGIQTQLVAASAAEAVGDFITARQIYVTLAEAGSADAQLNAGILMIEGKGGPRDMAEASRLIEAAAAQDHPAALRIAGQIEMANAGKLGMTAKARAYWARAAELGDGDAAYRLGQLMLRQSPQEDGAKALDLIRFAAENDHIAAQFRMSELLSQGRITPARPEEAISWLSKSANAGYPEAQFYMAQAIESGAVTPKSGDATEVALNWFRRAADGGFARAQRVMGGKYLKGDAGLEPNIDEAMRFFRLAAAQGEPGAQFNLGVLLASGTQVQQNLPEAVSFFQAASERGMADASYRAGFLLETGGPGLPVNINRAFEFYVRADQQGSEDARLRLGELAAANVMGDRIAPHDTVPWVLHAAGQGHEEALSWLETEADKGMREAMHALGAFYISAASEGDEPRDIEKAAAWYAKASQADYPQSQIEYARLLSQGQGVEQDYLAAHKWFNIAAARGIAEAAPLRDALTDLMDPEDIASAQAEASAFFDHIRAQPIPKRDEGE